MVEQPAVNRRVTGSSPVSGVRLGMLIVMSSAVSTLLCSGLTPFRTVPHGPHGNFIHSGPPTFHQVVD
jgi:hypothetical protein